MATRRPYQKEPKIEYAATMRCEMPDLEFDRQFQLARKVMREQSSVLKQLADCADWRRCNESLPAGETAPQPEPTQPQPPHQKSIDS